MHGSGNGIMCALGRGGDTLCAAISTHVAELVETANAAGHAEFTDRLARCIFDRKTANGVQAIAVEDSWRGLTDASAFEAWRQKHPALIERSLSPPDEKRR